MPGKIEALSPAIREKMSGVTWHEEIPSPGYDALALVQVPFVNFSGHKQIGRLITQATIAVEVLGIFDEINEIGFPLAMVEPMFVFAGDDGASMAANNSSCFNSRFIRNTRRLSMHALGLAIDINPVQNPVLRDGQMRPLQGWQYRSRRDVRPGMLVEGSPVIAIFARAGWKWGGHWNNPVDYHHFYRPIQS